jgi:hypothetical protein
MCIDERILTEKKRCCNGILNAVKRSVSKNRRDVSYPTSPADNSTWATRRWDGFLRLTDPAVLTQM